MRPLGDIDIDLTSYADDSYGIIEIESLHDTTMVSTKILDHLKWLRKSGMIVNDAKTEVMVLHRTEKIILDIIIGNSMIKSKNNMNVLGVLFNQNLSWSDHVSKSINSCLKNYHGLKVIRKFF